MNPKIEPMAMDMCAAVGDYKVWLDATGLFVFEAYILNIFFLCLSKMIKCNLKTFVLAES